MRRARRFAYQPPLDGLRAVAVMAVIAYHLRLDWARGGFLGVDAFFVLSGYLITSLLVTEWSATGRIAFSAFWARRARRLLPALFLVLLAVAAYGAFLAPGNTLDRLRGDGLSTIFYGANWRFVFSGQSYFDLFSAASPLRHTWSLAVEEQFYLVWPLVAFGCLWIGRGRVRYLAGLCLAGIAASMFAMTSLYDAGDPARAYYGTDTRGHVILIGAVLALLLAKSESPRTARGRAGLQLSGLVGVAYIAWAIARIGDTDGWMYRGGLALFAVAVAAVIAALVQPRPTLLRRALSAPPIVWIGRVSYGLYLWHWPVIVVLSPARTGLDGARLDLVRIGVTAVLATLSFYLVEQPIRRGALRNRVALAISPAALAVTALAVVVATAGATAPPRFATAAAGSIVIDKSSPTTTPSAGAPTDTPGRPVRILVVGDSVALSLYDSLKDQLVPHGVELSQAAGPGCGVVGGVTVDGSGKPYAFAPTCMERTPRVQSEAVASIDPDVVVWLSVWETSDRLVGGHVVRFGTRRGDAVMRHEIDVTGRRLTGRGARLVLLTHPPTAEPNDVGHEDPGVDRRLLHLNGLLRQYARRHSDHVALVDLAGIVCPRGRPPCPATIAGVRPRPNDGSHYEGDGARWVAAQVAPKLVKVAAEGRPGGGPQPAGTPPSTAAAAPVPPPKRILVAGDSIAYDFFEPLKSAAATRGVQVTPALQPGCSVAAGITTDPSGTPYPWGATCDNAMPRIQSERVAQYQPDLVVWISIWETQSRIVDGHLARFGTIEGNRVLTAEIDRAVARLTATGARLVLVTLPPPAAESQRPPDTPINDVLHLDAVLRAYAREHADRVSIFDLGTIVCPGGPPCPPEVAGHRPRPVDGNHYSPDGARWVAEQLLPQLLASPQPPPAPVIATNAAF